MGSGQGASRIGAILRATSGNFLEQFDFFLFGFYAGPIAKAFFPASNEVNGLLYTFGVFWLGAMMRPVGALVLGAYLDRIGRRRGLIVTLAIMAAGTAVIAVTPGYAAIGVAAPLLVIAGRLLQGFSAGVELGGVSVYLFEIAPPGAKGFTTAFQSASQQVAIVAAALIGYGLNASLPQEAISQWGWRIPFFIGCLIIPLIFVIRRSLAETPEFLAAKSHPTSREIAASLFAHRMVIIQGVWLVTFTTVSFYFITLYTPTFGKTVLKLGADESLLVALCVGVSNFVWLPIGGALSDRIGRRPVLLACTAACFLTAYPLLAWLVVAPTFGKMLAVELTLSALYGLYNGAMVVTLSEIVPPAARASGFSLAYSLAAALFGTSTPLASTWLIDHYGNQALPGVILMAAAAVAFGAALLVRTPSRVVAPSLAPAR